MRAFFSFAIVLALVPLGQADDLDKAKALEREGDALGARVLLQRAAAAQNATVETLTAYAGFLDRHRDPEARVVYDRILRTTTGPRANPIARRLVLLDLRDGTELVHRHVSLNTVFGGETCLSEGEVIAFATRMQFPEHHLVLKSAATWRSGDRVIKGINDRYTLVRAARMLLAEHGSVWVESDLRAMANPTRMQVIGEAAEAFAADLERCCPTCGLFHFAITQALWGLPCGQCGFPTRSTRAHLRECRGCGHRQEDERPDGKRTEAPQYCDLCNP